MEDSSQVPQTLHASGHLLLTSALPLALARRIPVETVSEIIAWTTYLALPTTALVCWTWHKLATKLLYSTVELRSRKSFTMLTEQLRTSARVKGWLAATRCLVISDGYFPAGPLAGHPYGRDRFLHALPPVFCAAMPGMQSLRIDGGLVHAAMPTSFFSTLSRFKALKTLHLSRFQFHSISELQRLISASPNLEDITLRGGEFVLLKSASDADVRRFQSRSHTRVQLQRLGIDFDDHRSKSTFDVIIDWLERSGICASLRHFESLPDPSARRSSGSHPLSTFCRYMNCRTSLDDTSSFVVMHHLQKHHRVALRQSDGRDLFRCHWNDGIVKCGLTLSAYQLARHISKVHFKHTGGPVQSKYCGKPFSRPDNSLKRHELDCEESSLVKNNVDIDGLLRAAGQFLTRVCISSLVTNNLEHNTALEFLHFKIGFRDEKYQSYGFLPTIAEALHPTLSTAQSHQLKQITISLIAAGTPGLYRSLDRPRANLKLKGLHDVMRRPCFEALLEVELQLTLNPPKGCDRVEKDGIINNLSASFNTLLSPWADRGLLRVSYKDIYI